MGPAASAASTALTVGERRLELLQPGKVVRMRNRLWRIENVFDDEFMAAPIDGRDTQPRRFLTEIEEFTEGTLAPPDPDLVSDPAEQDLFLRAFRLSLAHGSAPLMGLQRSRAIPTPYQLVPLLLAVGEDGVRQLIADDVGVGKTIEMGLVVSELIARGLVRRALFVVPANLREQTREALAHFFHIDAVVVAGHLMRTLERQLMPGQSVWHTFPFVVVSIDYAKKHPGEILDTDWDLVVFDEAHMLARERHYPGQRSTSLKQRRDFAIKAADRIRNLILMTATPHDGRPDSMASLVQLLDVGGVEWPDENEDNPVYDKELLRRHIIQRRRDDIRKWFDEAGQPFPFPKRDQMELVVDMGKPERTVMEALRSYTSGLASRSSSTVNQWVALHLQKRALSSPLALRKSIENRIAALRRKLGGEGGTSAEAETAVMDGDPSDDLTDEQLFGRVDRSALGDDTEIPVLEDLRVLAGKVSRNNDSKYKKLAAWVIPEIFNRRRNKRAIVFTRYKDTLDYLVDGLRKDAKKAKPGVPLHGVEVFAIFGDMNQKDRFEEFARFEGASRAVLVATDAISEGMNLQRACAGLVHYELPWNPNRLEQRNGRIDRFRQPEPEVTIFTLVYDDPLDVTILKVLVERAKEIRKEYGFCPPFFSSSAELVELMRTYGHAAGGQLTLFENANEIDPDAPIPAVGLSEEAAETILRDSFYGQQSITLEHVQRALTETHREVGTPEEMERFVRSALNRFGGRTTEVDQDRFRINLSGSPLLADLADDGEVTCTFDPMVGQDDLSADILDLAHPIVRRLIDLTRDAGLGSIDTTQPGRVAGYAHPAATEVVAVVHVLARFLTAAQPPVLLEELLPVAFAVWDDRPVRLDTERTEGLLTRDRAPGSLTRADITEAASHALGSDRLEPLVQDAIRERQEALIELGRQVSGAGGAWTEGMDEITLASRDLLTLTIVEPPT